MTKHGRLSIAVIAGFLLSGLLASPASAAKSRDLTAATLLNAKVPSLCGHPAGRLVNGKLPGIAVRDGEVTATSVKVGHLDRKAGKDGAVSIRCHRGGVPWSDKILIYSASKKGRPLYRGTIDLADIGAGHGREWTRSLTIRKRQAVVNFGTGYADECGGCASADGRAKIKLTKKGKLRINSRKIWGYRERASAFRNAYNKRQWKKVRAMSSSASSFRTIKAMRKRSGTLGRAVCNPMSLQWNSKGPSAVTCSFTSKERGRITTKLVKLAPRKWRVGSIRS